MKLIGTDTVDLGWGSVMGRIPAEVTQATEVTAGGEDCTQTWDYYKKGGYSFTYRSMPVTTYAELELFHIFDAEGGKNEFSVLLDTGVTLSICKFIGNLTCGDYAVEGTENGPVEVWKNVGFKVEHKG